MCRASGGPRGQNAPSWQGLILICSASQAEAMAMRDMPRRSAMSPGGGAGQAVIDRRLSQRVFQVLSNGIRGGSQSSCGGGIRRDPADTSRWVSRGCRRRPPPRWEVPGARRRACVPCAQDMVPLLPVRSLTASTILAGGMRSGSCLEA